MSEQKFKVGDLVRVRHFDEIDTDDIGDISYDDHNRTCYEIYDTSIDMHADSEAPYVIATAGTYLNAYVYRLGLSPDGPKDAYWWAQGMLYPYIEEELSDPDPEDLFAFLSSE